MTAKVEGDDVVLQIRDSGIGIDPQMIAHVFDPFWQVERTLDHSQGGIGIGLALVRRLAELHGGSTSAHSASLGSGSEFIVRLPGTFGRIGECACHGQEKHVGALLT